MQHLAPAMTTLVACSRTCWARDYPVGRCMLGQKDGCGADHDTELQRGAAPDLWQGGLGHNPLQRGAAPDLFQESTGHMQPATILRNVGLCMCFRSLRKRRPVHACLPA